MTRARTGNPPMVTRQTSSSGAATPPGPADATGAPGGPAAPPARRRRRWWPLAIVLPLVALLAAGARLTWVWLDPAPDTIDRSGPVLLRSIHDLGRYQAASGEFQVIVDLEKDAPFLPDAIKGTRTLFVGTGSVDAYVDFGRLAEDAITVSRDGTAVTVRVPRARLDKTSLDNARSYVVAQRRGLIDRLEEFLSASPQDQRELYLLAEKKIAEAAAASDLRRRAEHNTRAMLEGMLKALGFTTVVVEFEGAA